MADIRVPTLGESVTEATIGKWFKQPGEAVAVDEPLVELETDKVTIEVPAPAAGVLSEIAAKDGETVAVGALLGQIQEGARRSEARAAKAAAADRQARPEERTTAPIKAGAEPKCSREAPHPAPAQGSPTTPLAPSVRKLVGRERRRSRDRAGHRQGWPRHQGRHAGGDRARRRAPTPVSQPAAADAGARAVARRRRRARGAREDDAAAPDHRAPAEGGAEHRRDADDLQRGRHERRHGDAQPVQGPVREEARREARLHGLLRARLRAGAEGNPRRQRRDRRRRPHLQELLSHRRRGRHREGPRRAGGARLRPEVARRDREGDRRIRHAARATARSRSRRCRAAPSRSPTAASTAR